MLKDIPRAEYRLSMPGIGSILAVVLTPLLHKDAIDSTVCSHKRRFPTFLGYFLKATLGLIHGTALISRASLSGEGFDESRRRI